MRPQPKPRMTVDEFLVWCETAPGRHELVRGEVVAMAPERVRHAEAKLAVVDALRHGLRAAGVPCRAMPDGMTVRIDSHTAFEPDALVYCGPRLDPDAVEVPAPVVVVEFLSPGTRRTDTGIKLAAYFRLPSVAHPASPPRRGGDRDPDRPRGPAAPRSARLRGRGRGSLSRTLTGPCLTLPVADATGAA